MTQIEIKEAIDQNNRIIEALFRPNEFTLNNTVQKLLKENAELQKQCHHEFDGGYCIIVIRRHPKIEDNSIYDPLPAV